MQAGLRNWIFYYHGLMVRKLFINESDLLLSQSGQSIMIYNGILFIHTIAIAISRNQHMHTPFLLHICSNSNVTKFHQSLFFFCHPSILMKNTKVFPAS